MFRKLFLRFIGNVCLGNYLDVGLFRVRPNNKMTSLLPNFMPFGGLVVPYEKTFCAKLQIPN